MTNLQICNLKFMDLKFIFKAILPTPGIMTKFISATFLICSSILVLTSCSSESHTGNATISTDSESQTQDLDVANAFIDAFYSFDQDSLRATLVHADDTKDGIVYYQKWAECGNYQVMKRNAFIEKNDSTIICPITVKDDLMGALGIDFHVTDTFRLTFIDGQIRTIATSSNDPDEYYQAKDWVRENRKELMVPCEDGSDPCGCIKATIEGFGAFKEANP